MTNPRAGNPACTYQLTAAGGCAPPALLFDAAILSLAVRVFWVYAVLIAAAIVWNGIAGSAGPGVWAGSIGAGLALWTLLEYLIHRFAFHRFAPHWEHHSQPEEWAYIFAPLWLSLGASAILWPLCSWAAGAWMRGALVLAGIMLGYVAYEGVHVWIHGGRNGGALLVALRRHHFYHHFADDTTCFGVVTPFWDRIFGSMPKPVPAEQRRA